MAEEEKITLSEFNTAMDRFEINQIKLMEIVNYRFDKMEARFTNLENQFTIIAEQLALFYMG